MSETEVPTQSGGSLAAQAFRAAHANDPPPIHALAATQANEPKAANANPADNRKADRKLVNGRVRVTAVGMDERTGKMIDFSASGASILMDDQLPQKKILGLDCDVYYNGQHFIFQIEVLVMHSTLVSGKGFKMGLQFGPKCSDAGRKTISSLQSALGC